MGTAAPSPGWYADPAGAPRWRYWDGRQWTDQTREWFLAARTALGQSLDLHRGSALGGEPDDLRLGEGIVARLAWGGIVDRFSGDVTVQAAEGTWRLDQKGLRQAKLAILGPQGRVGLYERQKIKKGGPLTFADGRSYRWAGEPITRGILSPSFDKSSQWCLLDPQERAVLGARLERRRVTVTLAPEAAEVPDLGLLAGLGAYLVLRWWDERSGRYLDLDL